MENIEKMHRDEILEDLRFNLIGESDFLIMGDPVDDLRMMAESLGYQIIPIQLHSIDPDLRGVPEIVEASGKRYASLHVEWADPIFKHPEQTFLLVFYIEEAEPRAINALKSIIERKDIQGKRADNFFVGVVCRDANKEIRSTIIPLLDRIVW